MLRRENALELARVQQRYDWKRTFEMIGEFKQAVLAHGYADLAQEIDDASGQLEIVRDIDSVEGASPDHFTKV